MGKRFIAYRDYVLQYGDASISTTACLALCLPQRALLEMKIQWPLLNGEDVRTLERFGHITSYGSEGFYRCIWVKLRQWCPQAVQASVSV